MTAAEAATERYQQMRRCAGLTDFRTPRYQALQTACSQALEALWAARREAAKEEVREVGK